MIKGPLEKKMLSTMLTVVLLTVGIVTPALAAEQHAASGPTLQECYDLGWIRGVHIELGDLPDWNDQCMAGKIPFGDDYVKYYKRLPKKGPAAKRG